MLYVTWPRWPPCPYMIKTFKNLLLWNQKLEWLWNLVCGFSYSSTTKFVQIMIRSWPWPILQQGQIWSLLFLNGKDLQEIIEASEVKVGTYSQINVYMTIYDNRWSRSFIDLCPRSLRFNIFKLLFLKKSLGCLKPNFIWSLHGMLGWKYVQMFRVTCPKWCPGPYMIKTFKNHLRNQEALNRWPWNLVYSIGYLGTTKFVQMMTLGWPWPFLWQGQICFLMLLHGWKLIQHIVMYFQACSNSGVRYRTSGPLISN